MSQRDLVAELRGARIAAPGDVRERVRAIAASAPPVRRRFTWKRALVVALPAAAAVAATVVLSRPDADPRPVAASGAYDTAAPSVTREAAPQAGATLKAQSVPAATPGRVQRYSAYLGLRMKDSAAVSDGVQRALRITASLSGHQTAVHVDTQGKEATADLTLKIPRARVQTAISRFSQLGTITSGNVDVQDLQAGINATDRTIAKLQAEIAELRRGEQTDETRQQIAALVVRVQSLQRLRAETVRAAHFATVNLHMQTAPKVAPTPQGSGPFHGIGVAFRWIGIGAVYALAFGAPLLVLVLLGWLAARVVRRRREDELLGA